jgi:DnaK suppressor protein
MGQIQMPPSATDSDEARTDGIRAVLLSRLSELEGELAELNPGRAVPTSPIQYGKRAGDHIAEISEQRTRARAAGEIEKLADQVRAALARLDSRGYGVCEDCGRPIPDGRLEVLPWAVRCVDCASLR